VSNPSAKYEGHTAGPWQVKDIGGFGCKVIGPSHRHPQSFELGVEMTSHYTVAHIATPTQEQADANARLIADSPLLLAQRDQLLEACQQGVELLEQRNHFGQGSPERNGLCGGQCCTSCEAHDRLKAAIAAVEGAQ